MSKESIEVNGSPLFEPYTDPSSGVICHILTSRVAPVQQSFYFVNESWSRDGRYLWFYCAYPPSPTRTLAVVDFYQHEVQHFADTQFSGASPFVEPETGGIYWCTRDSVWTRTPQPLDEAQLVNRVPEELLRNQPVQCLATHLSRSADRSSFFIDAFVDGRTLLGSLPLDGSDFALWHEFTDGLRRNHAQFSPHEPDLALFAWDNSWERSTGRRIPYENRMYLIRRGEEPKSVFPTPTRCTHEWWDSDGRHIWCMMDGTVRVDTQTAEVERVWNEGKWHAHNDATRGLIVADNNHREKGFYRGCPSTVDFFNRETGASVRIVRNPEHSDYAGRSYHIDPHPRFCLDDRYIVFTTTVRGTIDLAIVDTAQLIALTGD